MKVNFIKVFLVICIAISYLACSTPVVQDISVDVNTVSGKINPSQLGLTLTHEHIMSNFGKSITDSDKYDTSSLLAQVIPYLKYLKTLGVESIVDCTANYFGRRTDLLKTISDSTGIRIITNTGIYGAANDKYIPSFAFDETAEYLSKVWIDEFENGIDNTPIKPGFVKLAFDDGTPSDIDTKLFKAGILTHLATGLTLAVHTGGNIEAVELQTKLLTEHKVHPSAWIWVHANTVTDDHVLLAIAKKGAWISLDGVNMSNTKEYIDRILLFKEHNLLHKLLLSHDGNAFPAGGPIRKFEAILVHLIPELLQSGLDDNDIDQLLVVNPREAFIPKIRRQ